MRELDIISEELLLLCKMAKVNSPKKLIDKTVTITYQITSRYDVTKVLVFAKIAQITYFNDHREGFLSIYFYPNMETRLYPFYEKEKLGFVYEESKKSHFGVKLIFGKK